jgi:hypothetical protein
LFLVRVADAKEKEGCFDLTMKKGQSAVNLGFIEARETSEVFEVRP